MRRKIYDDYYLNYDYDLSNSSEINDLHTDPFILPNPENSDKYTVDVLPNVELPDDSLADADLKDHDFMDNLMYVYYGNHGIMQTNNYGKQIIIIGSVLSCAAQLLTILFLLFKKNYYGKKIVNGLFLHLMGCSTISNLLFMLGVYVSASFLHNSNIFFNALFQATKNRTKCQIIAVILHYMHFLTAFWIFLYCYNLYKSVSCTKILRIRYILFTAYGLPLLLTTVSFHYFSIFQHHYSIYIFSFFTVFHPLVMKQKDSVLYQCNVG